MQRASGRVGTQTQERLSPEPSAKSSSVLHPSNFIFFELSFGTSLGSLCMWHLVAQLYPTLWDSTDCSPPNSSVHGISQARILDWAAISFSRASSRPRDRNRVSCIAGGLFTSKSPREALVKVDLLLTAAHSGCCRLPQAEEGHVTLNPHRQSLEEQLYSSLPRWMTPRQALERHQDLRVHH